MESFAEQGFAATRLDDIARRAGVAKGTIYLYFDSKEALFEEVVRANVLTSIDGMIEMIDSYPGPTEDLLRLILKTGYGKILTSNVRAILRIIVAEGPRFPEIVAFYHREVVTKGEGMLARVLERGIARGEFRRSAVMDAQIVVLAPVIAAAIWQLTFEPLKPLDVEAYMAAHLELLLNGISIPKA